MNKEDQKKLYLFQLERNYSSFYKNVLFILEDLRNDRKITSEEYQKMRKRILDLGNDSIRELKEYSELFFR